MWKWLQNLWGKATNERPPSSAFAEYPTSRTGRQDHDDPIFPDRDPPPDGVGEKAGE